MSQKTTHRTTPKGKQRSRPRGRPAKRRTPRVSPVTALFAGIFVLALVATVLSMGDDDAAGPQVASVSISGEDLPLYDPATADGAIGRAAPLIAGRDTAGEAMTIKSVGRPMAIAFLAHWCSHCQNEVRALSGWIEGATPDGVDVWAVSTLVDDGAPNYPPTTWLEEASWPVRTLLDDESSSAARAFGLKGTPFWVFLNADGTVAGRISGEVGRDRLASILDGLATQGG